MLNRMTGLGTQIATLLAAGAVAAAGLFSADSGERASGTALVVDAAAARDGRDLVDARLDGVHAELRLPRSTAEAFTNVRYFDTLGYRVVVVGRQASAAADAADVPAVRAPDLTSALVAVGR